MFQKIVISMLFSASLQVANAQALAKLELIEIAGENYVISGEFSEEEVLPDPLICSRAKKRMELAEKTTREIEYILAKVNNDASKLSKEDYENLIALERRRELDFAFLAQPAPVVLVRWNLDPISREFHQRILSEQVSFSIQTYSFDWEGAGNFFVPENRLFIFPKRSEKILTLKIKSQLSDYCFSDKAVTMKIWPLLRE